MNRLLLYPTLLVAGAVGGGFTRNAGIQDSLKESKREAAVLPKCEAGEHAVERATNGLLYCSGVRLEEVTGEVIPVSPIEIDWDATKKRILDNIKSDEDDTIIPGLAGGGGLMGIIIGFAEVLGRAARKDSVVTVSPEA